MRRRAIIAPAAIAALTLLVPTAASAAPAPQEQIQFVVTGDVTLTSNTTLTDDLNGNGQVDAGDTVTTTYTVTNTGTDPVDVAVAVGQYLQKNPHSTAPATPQALDNSGRWVVTQAAHCNADESGEIVTPILVGESVVCDSLNRVVTSMDLADDTADSAAFAVLNDFTITPEGALAVPASNVVADSIA